MIWSVILVLVGLWILLVGAEMLVKGTASLSKKAGIPPLVIWLTIVAFGTSAPEFAVNIFSSLQGNTDIALGNIIGSNIANILLVLWISAAIVDLKVQHSTTWKEVPFAILSVGMLLLMGSDVLLDNGAVNVISRIDWFVFLSFFLIFMYHIVQLFRSNDGSQEQEKIDVYSYSVSILLTIIWLLCLVFGWKLLVDQAVILAKSAGLSEMLIWLTIIAVWTNTPELATSIVAARKGHADIAIGNVVGSNIMNILWILGISSIIHPLPVNSIVYTDMFVCLIVTVLLFVFIFVWKKHVFQRWQWFLFVGLYIVYTIFILWRG